MKKTKINRIVIAALGMALVFLATYIIKIPNGIQGYFNLGDGFIVLFASLVSPFYAFLIGGLGSGLADIVGGYGIYFLPTLIIKGLEGFVVSYFVSTATSTTKRYTVYVLAGLWMVFGYFITDAYVNQSWLLSLTGVLPNLIQAACGIIIAGFAYPLLKKYENK